MQQEYIIVKCRNQRTGQTVKAQELNGWKWPLNQRSFAQQSGEQLAERLRVRSGDRWSVILENYVPKTKPDWYRR